MDKIKLVRNNDNNKKIEDIYKLKNELDNTKNKIDDIVDKWDIVKKIIYEHEYVYTNSNSNANVAKKKPISRSYFKLAEMMCKYNIKISKRVVCLAEAPGGFIQWLNDKDKKVLIYGISLKSDNKSVPKWNNILMNKENINFIYGIKENGDMYDLENIISFIKKIKRNSIELITGDGGIDSSDDYNLQEVNSLHIIYSEILIALLLQCVGGTFICKFFDILDIKTIKLIYLLYIEYEEVYIYKPDMSRITNSEKYIICRNRREVNIENINKMVRNFESKEIDIELDDKFVGTLYNINKYHIDKQIDYINKAIKLVKNNKLSRLSTEYQRRKAKEWCSINNLETRFNIR